MDSVLIPPLLVLMVVVVAICLPARIMRKRDLTRALEETNARSSSARVHDLSPGELAFLHGGPRQTMLAGLAEAAAERAPEPNTLAAVIKRHLDSGATSRLQLSKDAEPYLRAVTDRLEHLGLIAPRAVLAKHRRIGRNVRRTCYLLAAAFVVYCLVTKGDLPVRSLPFLASTSIGVAWAVLWPPRKGMPRLHSTAAGRLATESTETYDYLSLRHQPAYTSYGPQATAVATAVFGAFVLRDAYPDLADNLLAAELMDSPRTASGGGDSTSCGTYIGHDGATGCSASCGSDGGGGGCGGGGGD